MMTIGGLAYIVAVTTDVARWKTFAEGVLGMMTAPAPGGGLYVRMDERQFRILVQPGQRDGYVASGWEVRTADAFEQALRELRDAHTETRLEDAGFCALRCAQQVASFKDPSGNRHELIWGFRSGFRRFVSPVGVPGFLTGTMGMGHVVLPAPRFDETAAFWTDVMGFGVSDMFNFHPPGADGVVLPIRFFHCDNARHHSLALAGYPVESGCVHLMVEVGDMAEVGRAMDRVAAHQALLTATLGQHTNDRMTSFYVRTPSNFDVEYGFGGLQVDWNQHVVHEFTEVSLWGHDFSVGNRDMKH